MNQFTPENPAPLSSVPRQVRLWGILLGICLLVWLQFEDSDVRWVLIFSAGISTLAAAQAWLRLTKRYGRRAYWLTLTGLLAGALITPAALLIMALKTGLHGHQGPDFSGDQVQAVIMGTPIWLISGLLVGIGVELFSRTNPPDSEGNNPL